MAQEIPQPETRTVLLQTGLFSREENARVMVERLRRAGFEGQISLRHLNGNVYWSVGVNGGNNESQMILRLKDAGFESFPLY
jgi:2-iminoacetate synthase ThiH